MKLLLATHTDVGIKKPSNEDSAVMLEAEVPRGSAALVAIADGVGGLACGEVASADIVRALSDWFKEDAASLITTDTDAEGFSAQALEEIKRQWSSLIQARNQKIIEYGEHNRIKLGTTLTALMILPNHRYIAGHVGDSRLYYMDDEAKKAQTLTKDHTLAAQNSEGSKIGPDELFEVEGHNVLLQCIGATLKPVPDFIEGTAAADDVFLLCSDGFSNRLKQEELYEALNSSKLTDETALQHTLKALTETVKQRGEGDNITASLIKIVE